MFCNAWNVLWCYVITSKSFFQMPASILNSCIRDLRVSSKRGCNYSFILNFIWDVICDVCCTSMVDRCMPPTSKPCADWDHRLIEDGSRSWLQLNLRDQDRVKSWRRSNQLTCMCLYYDPSWIHDHHQLHLLSYIYAWMFNVYAYA